MNGRYLNLPAFRHVLPAPQRLRVAAMNPLRRPMQLGLLALVLLGHTPLQAAADTTLPSHVRVSAQQQQQLGIQLTSPQWEAQAPADSLDAQVIAGPDAEWVVTAPAAGVLLRVPVAEGQSVRAGEVLAELRSTEAPQRAAELAQAESAAHLAVAERDRDRQLLAEGIIPARRAQTSEDAAVQAQTQLAAVRTQLHLMGLNEADARAGRVYARAPEAGTVMERLVGPGQRVAELDPLLRLADPHKLMLELQLPVAAEPLAVGAMLRLPDGQRASVRQSAWAASQMTQTRRVLAALPKGGSWTPGQWIKVARERSEGGWRLPAAAVVRQDQQTLVFVRSGDGFDVVPVQVLGHEGEQMIVAAVNPSAMNAQAQVAVSGVIAIKGVLVGQGADSNEAPAVPNAAMPGSAAPTSAPTPAPVPAPVRGTSAEPTSAPAMPSAGRDGKS